MNIEVTTDVDYDVDEIIACMDDDEKREMLEELAKDFNVFAFHEDLAAEKYLSKKSPFDQKKILCNALGVPSYHDEQALRQALEKVITA